MLDWLFQYILGYCTSWGLAAIGEPPLTNPLPLPLAVDTATQTRNEFKEATPAWIIPIFMVLVAGRYIISFLVSFSFLSSFFYIYFILFFIYLKSKKKKKKDCLRFSSHLHRLDGVDCR